MRIPRWLAFVALLWVLDVSAAEAQCSYSVSPTTFTVDSLATSRTISVITGTQCSWTATSAVSWITIASGANGTGIGSTTFLVEQNATAGSRTGTLTVAGQTVSVTQAAGSCAYTLSAINFAISSAASVRSISIITGTQCSWTASSAVSWITITSGATGIGIGSVTFSVAANTAADARSGTLLVAGQTVTVDQAGTSGALPATPKNLRIVR